MSRMKAIYWPQIAACFLAGAAGGAFAWLVVSKPQVWSGLTRISAGDWLQASAAMIGVALTVRATLWLEDHKRKRTRTEEQRLIREALVLLKAVLPSASVPVQDQWELPKRISITQAHYEMVRTGLESLSYARQGYRIRSYNLWNALTAIDIVQTIDGRRIAQEENILQGDHITENILAISREKIEEFAQQLIPPIEAAAEALEEERI